ncbi:hypothetical protein ACA910_016360 [Epithemia clementina (nom. ined.)]
MSSSGAALDKKGSHQQQQKQQQKLPPRPLPPSSLTAAAAAAALEKKEKQQEAPFKKSNQPNAARAEGAKTNPPLSSGTTGNATGATGAAAKSPSPRPSSDSKTDSKKAASAASTLGIVKDPPTDEQKDKKDSHSNGKDLSKQEPRSNNGSNNLAEAAAAGATTNSKEEGRKRQQQEQQQIATIRRRRSKRVLEQDPIIAPGYGTRKDILRLTHELNWGNNDENNDNTNTTTLPDEVVEEIMKARGRGIRSSSRQREQQESAAAAVAATATPVSSAWADFMKEEGVLSGGGGGNKKDDGDKESDSSPNRSSKRKANPNDDEDNDQDNDNHDAKMAASGDTATGGDSDARHYVLPVEWEEMEVASSSKKKKPRATTSAQDSTAGGVLLQAGTLDANIVGRSKSSGSKSQKQQQQQAAAAFHCPIPTRILFPSNPIQILHVFTSCNAVHSFALATNGITYGWGRNECSQLGPLRNVAGGEQDNNKDDDDNNNDHEQDEEEDDDDNKKSSKKKSSKKKKTSTKEKDAAAAAASAGFPKNVYTPTEIDLPAPLRMAALGKSHSLFLLQDNTLFAVGANKSGQCSVKNYQEIVPTLRKCVLPDNVVLAQIACGEDFSMAISTAGHLYSCGSSQYGQLGTGETGEYFVTANKLAFTNVNVFERRTTFCHAPNEKLHTNSEVAKVVPIPNGRDILFQQVACGKHHTLLVEANTSSSSERPRVFSFGCGDYGCLGHGVQKDEYLPRMIGLFAKLPLGQVSEDSSFKVSAGAHCSLLQTPSGHVYYWGKHRSVGEAAMRPQLVDALANNQHVVTHCTAGGQTVVCSTSLGQTVAWGQGPHGELGLGKAKSSAKPTFVDSLNGIQVLDMAAGYGHTLFVVEKGAAGVAKLPQVDEDDLELLAGVAN